MIDDRRIYYYDCRNTTTQPWPSENCVSFCGQELFGVCFESKTANGEKTCFFTFPIKSKNNTRRRTHQIQRRMRLYVFFRATNCLYFGSLRFVFVFGLPTRGREKISAQPTKVPRLKPGPPPAGPRCARFFPFSQTCAMRRTHAEREPDSSV
jgi:hypothetical protein